MTDTPAGELLTLWTARLAFGLYVVSLAVYLGLPPAGSRDRLYRICWTAGCLVFAVHVACAFHFVHRWSHADAYHQTARQTFDLTGVASGFGLYLNYAFLLAWLLDAASLWFPAGHPRHRRRLSIPLHAFFAFMWFNAAVVVPTGPTRWAGVAAFALLGVLLVRCARRERVHHGDTQARRPIRRTTSSEGPGR